MSRIHRKPFFLIFPTLAALFLVMACGSDPSAPPAPGVEPEVINNTDAFQFQVSSVERYTGTHNYTWANTGTLANIDQSAAVTVGQAVLTILDADGAAVYSQDLSVDGSFASDAGTSGDWQVRVAFTNLTGTLNFRAEKRTP